MIDIKIPTPVAASVSDVHEAWEADYGDDTAMPPYPILCNGKRLVKCYNFNELEGYADCWSVNAEGKTYTIWVDGKREVAHHRVHGDIQLAPDTPELRTWFERHFPARRQSQKESE